MTRAGRRDLPLCPDCLGSIGGAHAGPDVPYRPALPGEPCGAWDHDDGTPDAYEVMESHSSLLCDGRECECDDCEAGRRDPCHDVDA